MPRLLAIRSVACASAFLLGAAAFAVAAQITRTIPADTARGEMTHVSELLVEVNGFRTQLAANVRIWSADNLYIVPSAIPPGSVVKYRLDATRRIDRVWVLTKAETDQPDPEPVPGTDRRRIPAPPGQIIVPLDPQATQ